MSLLLQAQGLTVQGPERVLLRGVDLEVYAGQVTALCGPSGAGKSVTARVCMGIVDVSPGVTGGSLRYPEVGPQDWLADRRASRLLQATAALRGGYLSYAPQAASSALNPGRTVGRHLELALARRRSPVGRGEGHARLRELLGEVGLPLSAAGALPGELSGGMCQRAALAIALACAPRLLVADEPETGLDPLLRRQIVELLVEVGRTHGCGILLISHHEDSVARLADHVVRLPPPAVA